MAARRTSRFTEADRVRLFAQLDDLTQRVRRLEARLREGPAPAPAPARPGKKARAKPPPARRRPRCPGCTLELPRGRRGDTCVWCGFRFDAVDGLLR